MIYFLQPVCGGPVKIGFTDNLESRHKQLESHYQQPLALLAVMIGGLEVEAEIHARFSHLRFGRTEQFRPSAELMSFIDRPLLVDPNPDAVELITPPFVTVKMDEAIVRDAKSIANWRGVSVAEYLSELVRPLVARDIRQELAKRTKEQQGGKG